MMKPALEHDGPIALRYPRGAGEGVTVDESAPSLPHGKGALIREGKDLLLLSIGTTLSKCLEAAGRLAQKGIDAAVINARFVKPLDRDLILEWAGKTGHVVTVEEHMKAGGFGSAVLELFSDEGLSHIATVRVGIDDQFVEHGAREILCRRQGISAEGVMEAAFRVLGQTENVTTLAGDGH
jgi:1-deoxy-D-xylulose-5-phosphate synthase